jgi:hypothetical protein
MLELSRKKAVAALAGVALSCVASAALGADCSSLGLPNPIYGAGGSAETQTIKAVATYLAGLSDHPITVFWYDPGACQGYQQYLNDAITNTAVKYWAADGTPGTCNATGHAADFSHMGNDHDFCVAGGLTTPSGYPDGFATTLAPIQTLNIIVDKDSSQKSISAEALYYILGFGAGATGKGVAPWTNPAHVVTRSPTSFASQFLAQSVFQSSTHLIFDDPGKNGAGDSSAGYNGRLGFRATDQQTVTNQIDVFGQVNAESPIGYVSGSQVIADEQASGGRKTKVLAYQHYDQTCGFWPDSTESSHDKINVRTGKYHFWSPGHFYYHSSGSGFANADVKTFIEAFVGTANEDVLGLVIDNGDVPLCAMQVSRSGLDGPISSVAPADPCGCYFESRVAGTAQCDSCREGHNEDCSESGAVCRRGYCEAY